MSSHLTTATYGTPPITTSLLTPVPCVHNTKKSLHTNISFTPPANSPHISQPATPSRISPSPVSLATPNANSVINPSTLSTNSTLTAVKNTRDVTSATELPLIAVSPTLNPGISS